MTGAAVIGYLADVARSVPELGLRTADVDALARDLKDCVDVDSSALQADSDLLRARIAGAQAPPAAFELAAAALSAAWSGSGGAGAARRAACGATLARADLARAAAVADTLAAAATGIDEVRASLARRLGAVDVTGIGGLSIPQVRRAFDDGDVEQRQADAWSAEIRSVVELVATGAADTRDYVRSILAAAMSGFHAVPTAPFRDRVNMSLTRGIDTPAADSGYPSQLAVLDAALHVATAAGSIAENVASVFGAGIEAAAALAPEPTADPQQDEPGQDEPGQDEPDGATTPNEGGPQPPEPIADDPHPAHPDADAESEPRPADPGPPPADPAGAAAPPPPPVVPPQPQDAPESGLALLGDG
ncbi:hypothetical protein [Jongsikchunia kroppenstedtii]|uniref:hypothetical protein n=1 Tax=Jongsikchunia kroppenstedtii TaxID=1121721 RepID=UPI00037FE9BD|nr:hypothetical protein [Jongsikchunia kroppenstedtii]